MAPLAPHPLDPLRPEEISKTVSILNNAYKGHTLVFRVITLAEPPKAVMVPFLEAEHQGIIDQPPPRCARVQFYQDVAAQFYEALVELETAKILRQEHLPGRHSYVDSTEMEAAERACLNAAEVQDVIRKLGLPEGATVCIEPWTYGTDGMNDMAERIIMCYFYMRLSEHGDANHYAYPLDICVEMSGDLKVKRILSLPSGQNDRCGEVSQVGVQPFDRNKIHSTREYHPDLVTERRTTTKPYYVVQPEGPSFEVSGNLLTWEKWRMRVGFNYREGLTLHDITYDGRSVFYRLSLSEMFVPYGDSRAPYPRKGAFDLGSNGAGVNANALNLGCDCLGHIKYFDGYHHTIAGDPVVLPNVVCCHEIDDGILWKHTNYRTTNAVVTRSRILVLQTIITVGNYEYIFAFQFTQDAQVNYEVRATGILSTAPINLGDSVPYGTMLGPGVMAPYHQHLFSLRIDPAVDGQKNSLMVEESQPMLVDDPAVHNPFGVGYTTVTKPVEHETPLDTDVSKGRVFKIVNENVINPITGGPVGYKLVPHYSQMVLAHPSSYHFKRSEFGEHAVWVTKYHEDELFSSGQFTMQSLGGEGIASWIRSRAPLDIRNEDIVVWHTFGTTHNPRVEDWPVMPAEKMLVSLKPVNFFTENPAIDVPISTQERNGSVLVKSNGDGKPCSQQNTPQEHASCNQ
ncbi:copper amine oxidase [Talaromyces proteolyticus]|uniref:Amine oxidase n=1 Tax=Talaromyces proteolyticus TaxID=1131652 RepID=A0AAD4KL12_9EURO|nr:copper amine oxidase [Talaromyces proteolyticus]KAH8692697.1 copper amine oxidase [Talaromyces proteolyticus]